MLLELYPSIGLLQELEMTTALKTAMESIKKDGHKRWERKTWCLKT